MERVMKKLSVVLISIMFFSMVNAQEKPNPAESLTPSSAILYMKTSRVKKLLRSVNYLIDNLLSKEQRDGFNKERNEFKTKTGIDFLGPESLKQAGIDLDGTINLAYFKKGSAGQENVIVYIPVLDVKRFPLKFVEIIKNFNKDRNELDVYPVITDYKGYSLYQIQKDVFCVSLDGYFLIASNADLVKGVVDIKISGKGDITSDKYYLEYVKNARRDYDLNFFAKRDFLKEMTSQGRKEGNQDVPVGPSSSNPSVRYVSHEGTTLAQNEKGAEQPKKEYAFEEIDYATLGAEVESGRLRGSLGVSLNKSNQSVSNSIDVIGTGMDGRAVFSEKMKSYIYLSLNFSAIENMCNEKGPVCSGYQEFKQKLSQEMGLDFSKDFVPYYTGVINIIAGKKAEIKEGRPQAGFAAMLPMTDASRSAAVVSKCGEFLKKKFKEKSGKESVSGVNMFWYIDETGDKMYLCSDRRGIYLGNDRAMMETMIKSEDLQKARTRNAFMKKFNEKVFFLAFVKNAGSTVSELQLAPPDSGMGGFMKSIGDVFLIGEKSGRLLTLDIEIEIKKAR
jgi:hypothetical protein